MAGEYAADVVADLQAMVAKGLGRWNLPPETTIRLLNLSENATFALGDPGSGSDLVLRLHRVGYSSEQEINSELAWVQALHRQGIVETARPQTGRDGALVQTLESPSGRPSRHAVAFERLPGKEPDAGGSAVPWFEKLGEITAKMHLHARSWRLPADFRRKRWDFEAMVGPQGYWGPWRAAIGLEPEGALVLERALAVIHQRLLRFGTGPDRFGLVHADLRLANLLVDGPHLRIIDFDDSGFSWFAYDFAGAVSFIEDEPALPQLLRAWITGYRRAAFLSEQDEAEIPTFVLLRRILLTAWLASHAEIPFAQRIAATFTAGTVRLAAYFLEGRLGAA